MERWWGWCVGESQSSRPFLLVFKTVLDFPRSSLPRALQQRSSRWGVRARWVCGNHPEGFRVLPFSRIPKEENSRIFCLSRSSRHESPVPAFPAISPPSCPFSVAQTPSDRRKAGSFPLCDLGVRLHGVKSPRIPIRKGFY